MRPRDSFPRNGSMHWRGVLRLAAQQAPKRDRHRSMDALVAWLLWGAFWVGVGVVVAWWATA